MITKCGFRITSKKMSETEKEKVRALYHKVTKKELFEIAWNWADLMTCDEDMTWMEKVQEELEIVKNYMKKS
jgi:nucleoside diphosphate kinase